MVNRSNDIVSHHFHQPDHSILSILPDKRTRGTATLYGCNDIIIVIGILSSFLCSSVSMMNTFNSAGERIRSHGHRHYGSSIYSMLFPYMIYHLYRNQSKLISLFNSCLENPVTDPNSNHYSQKKSLKIPKGQSESVHRRRTDNTMAKKDKQRSTKNTQTTKDRVTQTFTKDESDKGSFIKLSFAKKKDLMSLT